MGWYVLFAIIFMAGLIIDRKIAYENNIPRNIRICVFSIVLQTIGAIGIIYVLVRGW